MVKDNRIKVDLPDDVKNNLDRLSVKTKDSKASLIREAIRDLIEKYQKKGTIE